MKAGINSPSYCVKPQAANLECSSEISQKNTQFCYKQSKHVFHPSLTLYFIFVIFLFFLPLCIAAEDDVHIMQLNSNEINAEKQHNIENNQPNIAINHVQGVPVAVSFPKGDYQW